MRAEVEAARDQRRKRVRDLDHDIGILTQTINRLRDERRALEDARAALKGARVREQRIATDSHRVAGPAAIKAVAELLCNVGRTTQAEITRHVDKNSGTISHALRALEEDGVARRTGRRERGSDEWAWVGPRANDEAQEAAA